jgi:hypothetical protein
MYKRLFIQSLYDLNRGGNLESNYFDWLLIYQQNSYWVSENPREIQNIPICKQKIKRIKTYYLSLVFQIIRGYIFKCVKTEVNK